MSNGIRLGFLTHLEGQVPARELFRGMIELFVAAEELGFESGWIAQHHFTSGREGPGAGASPLTFLTAVAENTSRIRLGTAVITIPLESPIRLAEDAATLDAISGGRLELGVGSGYDAASFQTFGAPFEERRLATSRGVELLNRAFSGEPLAPQTGQVLHPVTAGLKDRVWQGIFSEEGARYAARAGSNLLLNRAAYGYDVATDIVQRPWADSYLQAWHAEPRNATRVPRIGLSRLVYPAADRATARAELAPGLAKAAKLMVGQGKFPPGLDLDGYLERFHAFYGHPEEVVGALKRERVLPVATDILCQVNPGVPTFDQTLRVLELIATEVAPALGWRRAAREWTASSAA